MISFDLMRKVDGMVGTPLVYALYLVSALKRAKIWGARKPRDIRQAKVVLVQKFFGLGSILNALPMLTEIRHNMPQARLLFVTMDRNEQLLRIADLVDVIIPIRADCLSWFIADTLRAIWTIYRTGVDVCFDLEFFSNYSMIMSVLSRARVRVGFFSFHNPRSFLLTHSAPLNHYKHISRIFLAQLEAAGLKVRDYDQQVALPTLPADLDGDLASLLGGDTQSPIITINPNASPLCYLRRWPRRNFAELIARLASKYPHFRYVLIGHASEAEYVDGLVQDNPSLQGLAINLAGRTDLPTLLALLKRTFLLVSNDSGPVHLAAPYQTNTVVLFGPECPTIYGPLNPNALVLYKGHYCSPCINVLDNKSFQDCQQVKCLTDISVEEVFRQIEKRFLEKGQPDA